MKTKDKNKQTESQKLIPKLRFPEFQDAGDWKKNKLGRLIDIKGRIGYRGYTVSDIVKEGEGAIALSPSNIDATGCLSFENSTYISWDKYEESPEIILEKGFTVLVKTGSSFGKAAFVCDLPVKTTINPQMVVLNPLSIIDKFLYLTVSGFSIQKQIRENAVGGAIPTLSQDNISKFDIIVPGPEEQQKIADCLSSLDELIAAQAHKLDTLKSHKKGLMQQLFPAPGQTTPTLRFPEFQDAGEWKAKNFGEVCKFVRGPFGGALKKDIFVKSGYAVYEQSHAIYQNFDSFRYFITEEKYKELKRFAVAANDIIMSCSGTMGKFAIVPKDSKEGVINQALLKLTVRRGFNIDFIKYTLELPSSQEKLLSQSAGGAIKNVVGVTQLKEIEIDIPNPPEQQKIADCLSSLDELIATQAHKLDTLKVHKKGLMQQLFPNPDEVNG